MPAVPYRDRPWRLIPPITAPGQLQMQIDGWLLQQQRQQHLPTLRFYQWARPTISLGHLQKDVPDHWKTLSHQGQLDLVRRPTGGRAVLHSGDLTYAIATRYRQGSKTEIYRHLCEFLIRGWRPLGLELRYGESGRSYRHRANCFGVATQADLVDGEGHKFIGSAQRYGKRGASGDRAVLQHGSMQLAPDAHLFSQLFAEAAPKSPFSSQQFAAQQHLTGAFVDRVIETLTEAAQSWFEVDFVVQPLSDRELDEICSGSALNIDERAPERP